MFLLVSKEQKTDRGHCDNLKIVLLNCVIYLKLKTYDFT